MSNTAGVGIIERSLVVAAQGGDTGAFEALVRRNVDRLHGAARLLLGDADLAEDAVQGALVRAWRDLGTLRDPDRFGPWLHKLLVRACYDEARHRRRWRAQIRVLEPVEEATVPEQSAVDDREVIGRAFRSLSHDHRTILILHFYLDLPTAEIGARLGIPPGTARSRLHYALAALRGAVAANEREDSTASGSVA